MNLSHPSSHTNILFLGTYLDNSYVAHLKGMFGTSRTFINNLPISTVAEVIMYCKKRDITAVVSTNVTLLRKLLNRDDERKLPTLSNYAGSLFKRDGIEITFIESLDQFSTVPYAKFMARRFISKLTNPQGWFPSINFQWEILDASNADRIFALYSTATLIAVDIETIKTPLSISCVGYSAIFIDSAGVITSHSCVLALDSIYALAILRKFNWNLQPPKVMQNGKYDCSYLSRYNAPVYNYLFDTATMFHCWYSELPKDLGFLGAFFVRDAMYWKDLANTTDLHEYYLYNCRDTWTTAIVAIAWLIQSPEWAKQNYLMEFPLTFPCHLSEMTGIKRDMEVLERARGEIKKEIESKTSSLQRMVGFPLNVNSPKQMKLTCKMLGLGDVESTDEKHLNKFMFQHPLNARVLGLVLDIRGFKKLISLYLRSDEDVTKSNDNGAKEFNGRILYSLIPHGTDTGRLASREHHFWTGLQIQNIPRYNSVKQTLVADDGFLFGEVDLEQAESRDTAYTSGDSNLISAVSGSRDFHSVTAASVSGRDYDILYDDVNKKSLDKDVRYLLGKKINHSCSYNMGAGVFVATVGPFELEKARKLLKLSPLISYKEMAEQMIQGFHNAYPGLRGIMYPGIWNQVLSSSMLVGATGWTRYCFGRPTQENKLIRNAYVAHVPQSLNAMVLNKAFLKVFYTIAMHPEHSVNFKLLAQIHDSILFQFRTGHSYLCQMVKECMEIPVTVMGYDGITRTFTVPAAIKAGVNGTGAKYWSETE